MEKFIINGGRRLSGEVNISGNKNASLAILAAVALCDEPCRIENLPVIADVSVMISIFRELNAHINFIDKNIIEIDPSRIVNKEVPHRLTSLVRSSNYFVGALLGRFGRAKVCMPGGCDIGTRAMDQHFKGFEALGAENNDWRLDYNIYLAVGSRTHHLTWQGLSYFYWDENRRNNIYESVTGEYVWKTNNSFSSVLAGSMDTYKRAAYGQQLSLGGLENEHFYGFPSSLFTGQARFFMEAEERFFPKFELGTVVPVFAIFARAGETATAIHEFEPDDLTYAVGFGVRFVMTKSVTRLVNHFDFSWPLNGPLVDPIPRFAFIGLFSL